MLDRCSGSTGSWACWWVSARCSGPAGSWACYWMSARCHTPAAPVRGRCREHRPGTSPGSTLHSCCFPPRPTVVGAAADRVRRPVRLAQERVPIGRHVCPGLARLGQVDWRTLGDCPAVRVTAAGTGHGFTTLLPPGRGGSRAVQLDPRTRGRIPARPTTRVPARIASRASARSALATVIRRIARAPWTTGTRAFADPPGMPPGPPGGLPASPIGGKAPSPPGVLPAGGGRTNGALPSLPCGLPGAAADDVVLSADVDVDVSFGIPVHAAHNQYADRDHGSDRPQVTASPVAGLVDGRVGTDVQRRSARVRPRPRSPGDRSLPRWVHAGPGSPTSGARSPRAGVHV